MSTFAIIETGGKQYNVARGQKIRIEKLGAKEGEEISFDKVLLLAEGDKADIGAPYVSGAKVEARVLRHERGEKKLIFKYHSKTRYRKKRGHRQHYTEVEIVRV